MTIPDYGWLLGTGIAFGEGTSIHVNAVDGLGRDVRAQDSDRPLASGAVIGPDYATSRTVVFGLHINESSDSDALAVFDELAAAWNSTSLSEGRFTTTSLSWKQPGQVARRVTGRPRRLLPNFSELVNGYIGIAAEFYAPDPRIVADVERVITLPYDDPAQVLPNDGNHPAAVVWDVGGVVTDPGVIRNESARFDLAGTVATTTFHRVRTDQHTVTRSSDSANMFSEFSGTWLEIPAGGGSFRSVGTGYGAAVVTARYRDTWMV